MNLVTTSCCLFELILNNGDILRIVEGSQYVHSHRMINDDVDSCGKYKCTNEIGDQQRWIDQCIWTTISSLVRPALWVIDMDT